MSFDLAPGIAPADLAACRVLLRGGSRTFFAASLLLPARVRNPASALYAFCRLADDAVDIGAGPAAEAIDRLRGRLAQAYAGRPFDLPADRAFAATVARFDIPRALPEALIEGFAWDATGRRYDTLADLLDYAARVAGSVGAMMALVMGVRSQLAVARAAELGMAMQLSNIARDVGEDARAGRLYLPLQWLDEAGIAPDRLLARPVFGPPLGVVVGRLLREADRLYARAAPGIADLPAACRPGITAARLLYAEIGREVERRGCDSVGQRARVAPGRKILLLCQSLVVKAAGSSATAGAEDAARFLVEAVSDRGAPKDLGGILPAPRSNLDARIAWLIDLFQRLERQDRLKPAQMRSARLERPRLARRRHTLVTQPAQLRKLEC
jgi:phytoene synthase